MSRLPDLADRIERLLLRHDEQQRANASLEQQLRTVSDERDNLRSRLAAARARIDALIDRLPSSELVAEPAPELSRHAGNRVGNASGLPVDALVAIPRSLQP